MFTGTALAAMLVHADARARSTGEPQNITWERFDTYVQFEILTSREIEVLREQNHLGDRRPYMTVLPNGQVETHRITLLPPEAHPNV